MIDSAVIAPGCCFRSREVRREIGIFGSRVMFVRAPTQRGPSQRMVFSSVAVMGWERVWCRTWVWRT